MRLSPTFPMQTQQRLFHIQSRRKRRKEFYPVVAAFWQDFQLYAACALNTVNSLCIPDRLCQRNLSENEHFLRGLSARIRRYGELVPLRCSLTLEAPTRTQQSGSRVGPQRRSELCRWRRSEAILKLRRRCHAAGWARMAGSLAAIPRNMPLAAPPSLFFRLHGLFSSLCAYLTRFFWRLRRRDTASYPSAKNTLRLRRGACFSSAGSLCCSTGPQFLVTSASRNSIFTPGPVVEAHTQRRCTDPWRRKA